ncbi:MAG: MmcQ/YjbR family DNA-binding protein [Planctomycetes bacterium]|nr:MmcQ/YjbR family DNA-binding protein [Planctomycetota bacterium]
MPVTPDQFRRLALACPDSEEGSHHGNADFRHGGRVFATIHPDGVTAMVKLPPGTQQQLLASSDACRPASGAWGRAGCTLVSLDRVTVAFARDALVAAWEFSAAAATRRTAKK